MIKAIELKNWKTHGLTRLSFSRGTNIIVGQMGAGKSSIMDAISFALFGNFPALQHRRTGVNKLIRNKPRQERKAHVRLEFTADNSDYVVTREITLNSPATARLEKNGAYFQSQPERVTEEIERALRIDYDLFAKAVYSEQNRLDYFMELRAGERKEQIDKLLGLDRFALAQENTVSLINRLRAMAEEGSKVAEGFDLARAQDQLSAIRQELAGLAGEKASLEKRLVELDWEEKAVKERLESAKKEYGKKLRLQKEMAELQSRSHMLQSEIEKIEKQKLGNKNALQKEYDALNEKLARLVPEERSASEKERRAGLSSARLQADLERLEEGLKEKAKLTEEARKRSKEEMEKQVKTCNSEIERINESIASSKTRSEENERWLRELESHVQKCPICERELTEEAISKLKLSKKSAAAEAKNERAVLEKEILIRKDELSALNKELNKLALITDKLKGLGELEPKIKTLSAELAKAQDEAKRFAAERERSSTEMLKARDDISGLKSSLDSLARMEGYLIDKLRAEKSAAEKQEALDSISVDEKDIDALQRSVTAIASQAGKSRAELDSKSMYLKDRERQLREKNEEIERINRIHDDIKRKRLSAENLGKFRASLEETQAFMRSKLINSINAIMNRMWPELYPYGDYPEIMLEASSDDYLLRVKTPVDGEYAWEDVQAIASGGERSTACLAMRIAFAMVLVPNLRWLILDEPTHNIDRQGLSKFINVFNETLPRHIDQVFIITHDEVLKQVANARIYTLNRNKEENKETEIIEA